MLDVEQGGDAGHQVLAESRVAGEDVGEASLLDVLDEQGGKILGQTLEADQFAVQWEAMRNMTHLVIVGIVDIDDLFQTLDLCSLLGNSLDV